MSASQIHKLRLRSNAFVANLDNIKTKIVEGNTYLENLNKQQLRNHKLADDSEMKHGLSKSYAAWKAENFASSYDGGLPNFFLTGNLFRNMFIKVSKSSYVINSKVDYAAGLVSYFGQGFGIAPSNHQKAQKNTTDRLRIEYKTLVLK